MRIRLVFALLILSAFVGLVPAQASSHREAPGITETPKVDSTDLYMFNSYEAGRAGYVTLIADYHPVPGPLRRPQLLLPGSGRLLPHPHRQHRRRRRGHHLPVPRGAAAGGHQAAGGRPAGLRAADTTSARSPARRAIRSPTLNVLESFTLWVIRGAVTAAATAATSPPVPARAAPASASRRTTSARSRSPTTRPTPPTSSRTSTFPGCQGGNAIGRVFVGQRKEPFAVNVGEIFDLVNTQSAGRPQRRAQPLEDKNITTFALEVPAACLTQNASNPVIGGWQTAPCRATACCATTRPSSDPSNQSGDFVQVSRLGMPLVNEVVIGLKDKNLFNAATPKGDAALATYVTNPTLPEILQILFGAAGVRAPNNFPRTDLVAAFATGIQGLNFLSDGQPHEMMRLNTSSRPCRRRSRTTSACSAATTPASPTAAGRATTWSTSSCGWRWVCSAMPSRASSAPRRTRLRAPCRSPTGAPGRQPVRHHLPLSADAAPGLAERRQRSDRPDVTSVQRGSAHLPASGFPPLAGLFRGE